MKLIYATILVLLATTANAQVPNGNFENWTAEIWTLNPDGWSTGNTEVQAPVTQETDAYEGDYAMRVTAIPAELGEYGSAYTIIEASSFPSTLDFYVKTACDAGQVAVNVDFKNEAFVIWEANWSTSETIDEWTAVSITLPPPVEPIITSIEIYVYAEVGDFSPGSATIAIDAMTFDAVLGIDSFEELNIQAYPNPANSSFSIANPDLKIEKLKILDITGRLVKIIQIESAVEQIDVSMLNEGIYILDAEIKNGKHAIQKIVVQR